MAAVALVVVLVHIAFFGCNEILTLFFIVSQSGYCCFVSKILQKQKKKQKQKQKQQEKIFVAIAANNSDWWCYCWLTGWLTGATALQ